MSYIDAINQATTASIKTQDPTTLADDGIMGKEDFLTLLVTQLQNQDPLNPDDPTEFTAQLAQFSSLEQLFNLNESMDNVASSVADSQKLSALGLIGKEVTYADSEFAFEGTPVQVGYSLDGEATDVKLQLQHAGVTVATLDGLELGAGDHFINWNGLTDDGEPAPPGDYTIVVQAAAAEGSVAAAPLVRSEVTGVDLEAGQGGQLLTKGGEVSVLKIKGVYEPGSGLEEPQAPVEPETAGPGESEDLMADTFAAVQEVLDGEAAQREQPPVEENL